MTKKLHLTLTIFLVATGCSAFNGGGIDAGLAIGAGADLFNAATLSDSEVNSLALQAVKEADKRNKVLSSGAYASRLAKLSSNLRNYDGLKVEFKAYKSDEANAFSTSNGSVRVNSKLMDILTDDELLFVLGHEVGHIKHDHSKEKVRLAYGVSAARKGVAASNSTAGVLAGSELGAFSEELINSRFSQSEETESDEYGAAVLKKFKRPSKAGPSALRKLGKLAGEHDFLSSHPDPLDRAEHLENLAG